MINKINKIILKAQIKNLTILIENQNYPYFRKMFMKARRDLSL